MGAYLALAGAMLLAGSTVVVGKVVAAEFPIFLGSGLRYAVAALVLLPAGLAGIITSATPVVHLATAAPGGGSGWGNLLVFGAVVCEALFTVLAKLTTGRLSPLLASGVTLFLGFLTFLPLALGEGLSFDWGQVSPGGWLALLCYGLFGTAAAYLLWYAGVARVDGGVAGGFAGRMPVSALALARVMLGEPVRAAHLLGGLLVLGATGVLTRPAAGESGAL